MLCYTISFLFYRKLFFSYFLILICNLIVFLNDKNDICTLCLHTYIKTHIRYTDKTDTYTHTTTHPHTTTHIYTFTHKQTRTHLLHLKYYNLTTSYLSPPPRSRRKWKEHHSQANEVGYIDDTVLKARSSFYNDPVPISELSTKPAILRRSVFSINPSSTATLSSRCLP